jgi:hypothetical protein
MSITGFHMAKSLAERNVNTYLATRVNIARKDCSVTWTLEFGPG